MLMDTLKDLALGVLVVLLITSLFYNYKSSSELEEVTTKYTKIKETLDILSNETAKDVRTIEKEVVKIQKVYVPKKEYIVKFVKDVNETDCNASNRLLSNFEY